MKELKSKRQMIIDGSTLFGVSLTLFSFFLGMDFENYQELILIIASLYFFVFSISEFFGIGYKIK